LARGHRIDNVPEVPLVVDDSAESLTKTKEAIAALKKVGAFTDVEKARDSRKIRRGVGKMRNRRHVQRRGPLVVYSEDKGLTRAFRNLPGIELANVERLNLLQLAPGGHLGRFIVWTRGAFAKLAEIYGSVRRPSSQKKGWTVPRNIMTNSDVTRLINSDEVQSKVRAPIKGVRRAIRKKNPLVNLGALVKLNPYALSARRSEVLAQQRRADIKAKKLQAAREKKAFPEAKHEVKQRENEAALVRAHEPQQRENYKRLVSGETYAPPADKAGNIIPFELKITPRPFKKGILPKGPKKEKKKKVREKKEEKKEEKKGPIDWASRPMPKMPVMKREPRVKKAKKEGDAKKGKKGAKGEAGKEGGKEEPKGKGEAPKGGAKKEEPKAGGGKKEGGKGKGKG